MKEELAQTEKQKSALARIYSEEGVREYLLNMATADRVLCIDAVAVQNNEQALYYASRVKVIEKLLSQGEYWYKNLQDIK